MSEYDDGNPITTLDRLSGCTSRVIAIAQASIFKSTFAASQARTHECSCVPTSESVVTALQTPCLPARSAPYSAQRTAHPHLHQAIENKRCCCCSWLTRGGLLAHLDGGQPLMLAHTVGSGGGCRIGSEMTVKGIGVGLGVEMPHLK